jgi:two-component system, chemotaxis family, response regulator Rcp1
VKETIQILLAEDNPADAFLVEEALSLTNLNFHLTKATDGEAASQILVEMEKQTAPFRLILLDLNLPKISGHQLLAQVRHSEQLRTTPVIVLTSSDSPQDRARTAALHISHYFRKPTDLQDFLQLGGIVEAVCHGLHTEQKERSAPSE